MIATIGFCNTGVAMKSIDVFQASRTPLIVPCTTGTPVTTRFPPAESYIFRNAPPDAIQAPFMVDEIVARGWTRWRSSPTPPATAKAGCRTCAVRWRRRGWSRPMSGASTSA